MSNKSKTKKIGIYKELAIVMILSIAIAVFVSLSTFIICSHYGILVDEIEDYSDYKSRYDIQVMEMVRELDNALNIAIDEINANNTGEEKTVGDAMKYLLDKNQMPFTSEAVSNMTITVTNRNGLILWKTLKDGEEPVDYKKNKTYVDIESLVTNSYDDCTTKYSFVYTKSVSKALYYIIFETDVTPEYLYADMKLKAACIVLGAFIFVLSAMYLVKKRIDYIRYLSGVVDQISQGNLDTKISKKGADEITIIAESIDDMQHNLDKMMREERENDRKNMELITNLSHDIKTPMTIITGYLDVVISGKYETEAEKDEYLKKAFNQVEKINGMIHKIFLLAKNEKIQTDEILCKCNIAMMLSQDISEFVGIAAKENRHFNVDIPDKPLYSNVNIENFKVALDNIIMNSIKYSMVNSTIRAVVTEENDYILIALSNETNCLTKSDCDRIFDKFYRADLSRNSNIPGNGLGLSIVKDTIELYGGKIWAEYDNNIFCIYIRLIKCA